MRLTAALLTLCMWLAASGAQAAEQPRAAGPAAGMPWAQLSEDQRTLLSDLQSRWGQLPPERQSRLAP